ncbi:hypothetical protein ACMT4L_17040 [Deinococcus sp. A31D244]
MAQEIEQLAQAHGLTTRGHDPRPLLASLICNQVSRPQVARRR